MRRAVWVVLFGFVLSPQSSGADPKTRKLLVGRWALVEEKPLVLADAKAGSEKKPATRKATSKKKPASKKGAAGAAAAPEIPGFIIEFTGDGKLRLDGNASVFRDTYRFLKPLADFNIRVAPEARYIKISYEFIDDESMAVVADHSALLEKLSAGASASLPPDKIKELTEQFFPRETLTVAVTARTLTLTNERGKSRTFRRHTGGTLAELESKQRDRELRQGLDPFRDILKQQGINVRP
jgi:hypothetical protein